MFLSGASIKGCCLLPGLNRLSSLQNYLLIRRSLLENFRFGHVVQQVIGSIIIEIVSDRLTDCREWNIDNARNVSEGQLVDQRVVNDVDSLLMCHSFYLIPFARRLRPGDHLFLGSIQIRFHLLRNPISSSFLNDFLSVKFKLDAWQHASTLLNFHISDTFATAKYAVKYFRL